MDSAVKKGRIKDIEGIQNLVNHYAGQGLMLPRSNSICQCLREFIVAEEDGKIIGTGALHLIWMDLAEIRS